MRHKLIIPLALATILILGLALAYGVGARPAGVWPAGND